MRQPFKKIFAFALGIMLVFLVVKLLIGALFLAMLISIPYLLYRGLKSTLVEDHYHPQQYNYNLPDGQQQDEPLFYGHDARSRNRSDRRPDYHFVDIQ
jgi:uncharacterized membrane protein YjgN (DUF898 family)